MLEKDFIQRYRAMQEAEQPPANLLEITCTLCQQECGANYGSNDETATVASSSIDKDPETSRKSKDKKASTASPRKPTKHHRFWVMPIAACLAILLVLFGAGTALFNPGFPFVQSQARAYAKTPNLLTTELNDGIVPFALDGHTAFQGWDSIDEPGCFTGIQFTIEGENIARVQATISRGELYQLTTETYDRTTEKGTAILKEASSWKPSVRGTGEYLKDYDWVTVYMLPDDLDKNDPQQKEQLRLIKRIGSTIDMPYGNESLTLGLWFDDITFLANGLPNFHDLDGTELTITAEYTNGTFRTQKMILHDGWFTTHTANSDTGADSIMAEGPFATQPKSTMGQTSYCNPVYTLYGEVTSITDQPHPYSLESANERADEAQAPYRIEDELPSYGSAITAEDVPSNNRIHSTSDNVLTGEWNYDQNGWTELRWHNFAGYVSNELSPLIAPYEGREVIAFNGNYDYLNRCRLKTNGWSITEEGQLNEGNSFVMINVDITNDRKESVKVDTEYVGAICAIDYNANATTFATPIPFAAKDNKARLWTRGNEIWIEAGETVHLEVVFIVDDSVANADNVNYALGTFTGLNQGKLDGGLDSDQYISLGKLEWR